MNTSAQLLMFNSTNLKPDYEAHRQVSFINYWKFSCSSFCHCLVLTATHKDQTFLNGFGLPEEVMDRPCNLLRSELLHVCFKTETAHGLSVETRLRPWSSTPPIFQSLPFCSNHWLPLPRCKPAVSSRVYFQTHVGEITALLLEVLLMLCLN